jgi:hypothetical protein
MTNTASSRFRRFFRDSIFVRVCVFIYGAIFLTLGSAMLLAFVPTEPIEWLITAFGVGIGGLGSFMVYASVFGRLRILEKASDAVSDGGEIIGIIFMLVVLTVALPITAVIKLARSTRRRF